MVATGPDSINVSWDPPPQQAQNGNITAYSLTCQPEDPAQAMLPITYPAPGSYNLRGFSPATTYNCSVFASTAGGSGPSALQTVTLLDDGETCMQWFIHNDWIIIFLLVPGPVEGLMFTKISTSVLQILWSSPESNPGRIQQYLVLVETRDGSVLQESVPGTQTTILIANLSEVYGFNNYMYD